MAGKKKGGGKSSLPPALQANIIGKGGKKAGGKKSGGKKK